MLLGFVRNRTFTIVVMYSLYLYFLGLSLRNTSKALDIFDDEKRSHIAIWNWIQRFGSYQIYKRKRISAFVVDETTIQIVYFYNSEIRNKISFIKRGGEINLS